MSSKVLCVQVRHHRRQAHPGRQRRLGGLEKVRYRGYCFVTFVVNVASLADIALLEGMVLKAFA